MRNYFIILFLIVILSGCSLQNNISENKESADEYSYLDKPYDGHYKLGDPYQVEGEWYFPSDAPKNFYEIGNASWYGHKDGFHGKKTANGDVYNKNTLTAAHKTLPLPSMARVTNLENGHSVIVMINDRGPFTKDRVLDVSERAADLLDFKSKGVTKVRVEHLPKQTADLIAKLGLSNKSEEEDGGPCAKESSDHKAINVYFVQVGAYKNKKTAVNISSKVKKLGKVHIEPIKHHNKTLYRVRVGSFGTMKEASEVKSKVNDYIKSSPMIITESGKV